jgi:8-oxo-dGTP diphosphatase
MVTVDVLLFNIECTPARVLLIRRKNPPFQNLWAIPGGFIEMDEEMKISALRELKEETGVDRLNLVYSTLHEKPGRDPRGRTITGVYVALLEQSVGITAGDDASDAEWFPLDRLPQLAFDHNEIIQQNRLFVVKKVIYEGWNKQMFFRKYSDPERKKLCDTFGVQEDSIPPVSVIEVLHQYGKINLKNF